MIRWVFIISVIAVIIGVILLISGNDEAGGFLIFIGAAAAFICYRKLRIKPEKPKQVPQKRLAADFDQYTRTFTKIGLHYFPAYLSQYGNGFVDLIRKEFLPICYFPEANDRFSSFLFYICEQNTDDLQRIDHRPNDGSISDFMASFSAGVISLPFLLQNPHFFRSRIFILDLNVCGVAYISQLMWEEGLDEETVDLFQSNARYMIEKFYYVDSEASSVLWHDHLYAAEHLTVVDPDTALDIFRLFLQHEYCLRKRVDLSFPSTVDESKFLIIDHETGQASPYPVMDIQDQLQFNALISLYFGECKKAFQRLLKAEKEGLERDENEGLSSIETDSIAFVAQNIAMIYDVLSLSDYCTLPWYKLLYAVGLCDCISYLRTGRMQPSTIYNAVVCAKKREVRLAFDRRLWTWDAFDKYTMIADFVIALEYQIFRVDTDALPEDIIDILIEDQNRIRDEIVSTLALGTKAPLYENVRANVACMISAPSFESILQTFEDYSAECLFEDQHLSPQPRG